MGKNKSSDVLSLDKGEQKKVVKQTKKLKKSITDGKISIKQRKPKKHNTGETRGLVYIAHIPHGFFEEQMKNYFKQFGVITNVKVCRSKKNGNSKGYGYVEFLHPEVAKIAAETMNNYIMFKKRIVAQYVPYEKRPKGLFSSKKNTASIFSSKIRREKQIVVNSSVDPKTHLKRSKTRLANFHKKMKKLQNVGIDSNVQPTDLPEGVEQPGKDISPATHQTDPNDSDIEVRIPLRKSKIPPQLANKITKKSGLSIKSKSSSKSVEPSESNKILLAKSLDSVKTLLSNKASSKSTNINDGMSVRKVNKATSIPKFTKSKDKSNTGKGVTKKGTKQRQLSPEMLKKIARELIRKRGHSLLNLVTSPKKKSSKKKTEK